MNKMKIIFAATFLILFSTISCQKEIIVPTEDVSVKEAGKETFRSIPASLASSITDIGTFHNPYLADIFANYNYSNPNKIAEGESQFLSSTVSGLSQQEKQLIIDKVDYRGESYLFNNVSSVAAGFINSAKSTLTALTPGAVPSTYFSDLEASILVVQTTICPPTPTSSTIAEQVTPLTYCEVMLKSADFWLPTTLGGSGAGSSIITSLGGSSSDLTLIKKIILADAAAAGAYMQNIGPLGTNNTNTIAAAAAFAAANFMITAY